MTRTPWRVNRMVRTQGTGIMPPLPFPDALVSLQCTLKLGSCNHQTFARILPYQMLEVSMHDRQVCMAGQLSAKETPMDARTYKLIELVGVSNESYSEATKNAIARASETLRGLGWFEVTELRGLIQNGRFPSTR